MNRYLEFHDSTLSSIEDLDGVVRIYLSPAIIHQRQGELAVNGGTVWLQDVEIVVPEGSFREKNVVFPSSISDGSLKHGDNHFENIVEIPFSGQEDAEIQFVIPGPSIEYVVVRGKGVAINIIGEPLYLEDFPSC